MSTTKDPLKKLTHVRMSKSGSHAGAHNTHKAQTDTAHHDKTVSQSTVDTESGSKLQFPTDMGDSTTESLATPELENVKSKSTKSGVSQLPDFLSRFKTSQTRPSSDEPIRALAVIEDKNSDNPNSFGSIFNKEHEELSGIQRVFKKSIAFLVINLMLFGMLVLASINLLTIPVWFTVIVTVLYTVTLCLFFIILADRSYLWLNLAGQVILLLLVHSFLGRGFDLVTILVATFCVILLYSAYTELEKIQLGSRLFFISHITGESIRIITTVTVILISLGFFNSIVSTGTEAYVEKNIFSSDLLLEKVIIGEDPNFSVNRIFLKGSLYFTPDNTEYTFRDFLTYNYRNGKSIFSQEEANNIIIACQAEPNTSSTVCNARLNEAKDTRLLEWQQEAYPTLAYNLDDVIGADDFKQITKQHYLYLIRDLARYNSSFTIIPPTAVIPAFFAISLFAALLLVKSVIGWLSYIVIWIVWKILKWIGFVRIEVEAVEAEIVSI